MEITIVTGLSGAGKSRDVDALEDIGYFCVDNMPPKLMPTFAQLLLNSREKREKVAIVTDILSLIHISGSCIKADITIAVSCMKPVHILKPARVLCGEIITVAIGIDDDIIEMCIRDRSISGCSPFASVLERYKSTFTPVADILVSVYTFGLHKLCKPVYFQPISRDKKRWLHFCNHLVFNVL